MTPRSDLASTGYCLARPGVEYLVYQPKPDEGFTVCLETGRYGCEWFNPSNGEAAGRGWFEGSGKPRKCKAPFHSDAVVHIKAQ